MGRLRLRREGWWAVGAAAALLAGLAAYQLWRPIELTVAVPRDGEDAKVIEAFGQVAQQQRASFRLRVVPVPDIAASAKALEGRQADLAVVRPDVQLPVNGLTVAILREEAAILLAPAAARIEALEDLARRRLGIVAHHPSDERFIADMLAFYELGNQVTLQRLEPEGVEAALKEKRVDAVAVIGVPGGKQATAALKAVERAAAPERPATGRSSAAAPTDGKVVVLSVADGAAIQSRLPAVTAIEVPTGALGGRPRQPAETLQAVGVSYRLLARADLDPGQVAGVTRLLFEMRPRLARVAPAANLIKAPESIMSATLPNHPGAIQYLERETLTFFERYGDWVYLLMFSMGGIGSAVAWLRQRVLRRRRELVDEVLDRLLCILSEARAAGTGADLDGLAVEIDNLVTHAVRYARRHAMNTRVMSALIMAIDSARAAVADRRGELDRGAAPSARRRSVLVSEPLRPAAE